jgi:hypothetical protein
MVEKGFRGETIFREHLEEGEGGSLEKLGRYVG